jgi:hypothetical protein
MKRRRILFAALACAALTLGVGWASPAHAWENPLSATVDKTEAQPGDTVEVTVRFTNVDPWDVVFSYMSIVPAAATENGDVDFGFTGCAGQISWCSISGTGHGASVHHDVLIPPGGTREVRFSYDIAEGSPCGEGRSIGFFFYTYRETTQNATDHILYDVVPSTAVSCS